MKFILNKQMVGAYLRELRLSAGLTQEQLGAALGLKHWRFLSQIEAGTRTLPEHLVEQWASATGADPATLAWKILEGYHPDLYRCLTRPSKMNLLDD